VFGLGLASLDYAARLAVLLEHGIGLWDVIAEAERIGSLDAAIRNEDPNDVAGLVAGLPALRTIGFNGAAAARIGTAQLGAVRPGVRLLRLPSSSPAHARPFELKLEAWLALRTGA
jgi:double-stranded uracil-DNA glycosylase